MSLAALLCIGACGWLALQAGNRTAAHADALTRLLVLVALFFACFFLTAHALALVQLLCGARIVTVPHAALLLSVTVVVAHRLKTCFKSGDRPHFPGNFPLPPPGCADGLVPVATMVVFLLTGAMLVSGYPQGYEVLSYHLPLSVSMLQTQTLQAWDGNFPHTFPANASVLFAFLLAVLPEKLAAAANLLLLMPLALAVYGLCRLADADRRAALLATCGLLSVPMVAFSAAEPCADIGGIAFVALALYFALCRRLPPDAGAVLAGLCAGLAFGFKSLHLISAGVIGLLVCAERWQTAHRVRAGHTLRHAILYAVAALVIAGFWLLRNAIAYGNPLYPVVLPLIGRWLGWLPAADVDFTLRHATQFEWVAAPWQWLIYAWTEPQRYGQNFKHSSGLGALVAAAIPATALALGTAVVRDGVRRHRVRVSLALAAVLIMALWWLLDDRQPRYALAALVCTMPLLAWAVTQAEGRWRTGFECVLTVCVLAMLGVFLSRQALQFGDRILLARQTARAQFYEYPAAVDRLPPGSSILNLADRSRHYPLAGAQLGNRVVSMPEGRRLLGLPPSLSAPARAMLRAAPLRGAGITHVYVAGTALAHDSCMRLVDMARQDRNPVNGVALASPRILYEVRYLPCAGNVAGLPVSPSE